MSKHSTRLALGIAMSLSAAALHAQAETRKPAVAKFDVRDVAYMTCGEAWDASGASSDKVIALVKSMAGYSLGKRQMAFPDTKEAGAAVGTMIKERCAASPDESLLSIVDRSIRDHLKPR